jgi:Domain of unknown function (DUF1858)
MEISEKTKIDDLLNRYPFLLDFFIRKSSHFKNLKNPIMRKTLGKVATLSRAAAMGKLDLNDLLRDLAHEIQEKMGAIDAQKTMSHVQICIVDGLKFADAIIFGTPTRFGNMYGQE